MDSPHHIGHMYAKLFSSLLSSSVWSEDSDTCKVWITLIALADREGFVYGSPSGLARICALSVEKVEAAIEKFLSSDKHSSDKGREPERDGRRIEAADGGWVLLNYAHYRDLSDAEVRRAQYRASKRKIRGRSTNVNSAPQTSTTVHPSESSSESESKEDSLVRSHSEGVPDSAKRVRYAADFEEFWMAFSPPSRRLGKGAASKIWARLSVEDRQKAVATLPQFKESNRGKEDRHIATAPTYLSQRRFDDFDGVYPPTDKGRENYRLQLAELAKSVFAEPEKK